MASSASAVEFHPTTPTTATGDLNDKADCMMAAAGEIRKLNNLPQLQASNEIVTRLDYMEAQIQAINDQHNQRLDRLAATITKNERNMPARTHNSAVAQPFEEFVPFVDAHGASLEGFPRTLQALEAMSNAEIRALLRLLDHSPGEQETRKVLLRLLKRHIGVPPRTLLTVG